MTQAALSIAPSAAQPLRPRSIGLCLIVKNEAQVITRCLDSVKLFVDFVLVEDTGSTDGTQQIIADWLRRENVQGLVVEEPWQNFAYNRSHALEWLRTIESVDYALIMDADDQLVLHDGFDLFAYKASLDRDLYDIQIRHGNSRFYRPQLCANRLPFCFKGVLHEYLETPPGHISRANAEGLHVQTGSGGVRSRNPRKYEDDAAALARTLETETDPFLISRYTFYLAQSYRDCGEREKALAAYLKRAELGYWAEEVFESLYAAAQLQEELNFTADEVIATYLRATDTVPTRAEALHGASHFCRSKGRNEEGVRFAKRGLEIPLPTGGLFVKSWIYEYGLLDELAINAYWSGHYRESLDACLRLLQGTAFPADQRDRVARNARFALEKLPKAPELGSAGKSDLLAQHALAPARPLRSQLIDMPKVLLTVLATQQAGMLPLFLDCIEALDYPKSSIVLYVRTNDNADGTGRMLRDWIARVGHLYADVEFTTADAAAAQDFNATDSHSLGFARNLSLHRTLQRDCAFCFVTDIGNLVRPCTLRELVALNLPITAPLLRSLEPGRFYSNYHAEIDAAGYYKSCDQYMWLLNRWVRGVIEVPVVQTTYLVRADAIPELTYTDTTERHSYVVFSDSARRSGINQYLDNRQVYGYIAPGEDGDQDAAVSLNRARELLATEVPCRTAPPPEAVTAVSAASTLPSTRAVARPRVFASFGLHSSGSTWMFNLVREICAQAGIPFVSIHRDWKRNLPWDTAGEALIVAKSHSPDAEFRAYAAESSDPVLITTRDPRDAMASLLQRFPNTAGADYEKTLKALVWSAECMVSVARARDVPVFRYEDGFIGSPATFDRVAGLLGVTLSPEMRSSILAGLAPDAVRATITRLQALGSIRGDDVWDRETHWHANHVGDGRVNKWHHVLSDQQAQEISARTAEYCRLFGYPTGAGERKIVAATKRAPAVINILRPGAIGDVLMTSAVTAQFAARDPEVEVHYYTKIPQMAELLVGVHKVLDADHWGQRKPGADFNLIGYPIDHGYPETPILKHLTACFCAEAGLPPGLPQLRDLEPIEIKQRSWITIHPKAGWSAYKEWSIERWNEIVKRLQQTYPETAIVQIGGAGDPALRGINCDMRGRTSISQALWLLKNSVLHLGGDSFTNHAAGAFRHPAVIVFGSTSPIGSGYDTAVNLWAGLNCSPCYRENPALSRQSRGPCINPPGQVYEQPHHACMQAITVDAVWQAIMGAMPSNHRQGTDRKLCDSRQVHEISL